MAAFKLIYENAITGQQSKFILRTIPAVSQPDNFTVYGNNQIRTETALSAAIMARSTALPVGCPAKTTLCTTEIVAGRQGCQQYINPYWTELFYIDRVGVGDKFILNNDSYIIVSSISSGTTTIVNVEYRTKRDFVAYYASFYCSYATNNAYNNHLRTFPWLLAENTGYVMIAPEVFTGNGSMDGGVNFSITNAMRTSPVSVDLAREFWDGVLPIDEDDPYQDVDDSEPSGPAEGTGIPDNDPVDIPDLPTVSAIDTGFVSLFNPTLAEVKSLADYMWTDTLFDISNFQKIFEDPMECILGFNIVPVDVPASGRGYVCVGNIVTTIQMTLATSQWVEVNCGTVDLGLPYGNYLDYAPNTKYSIYLPYIGIKELSTDDVAGKVLTLKYHVDVLSCACIAYLKCGDSVLYQFAGSCGYSIPVTSNDFSRMIGSIIDIGLQVGGAVAGGNGIGAVGSIAKDVMGLKPDIHRSGSIGSSTGLMGLQVPFLILEIPNACKPKKQYHYLGYPSFVTVKLGDISGFASFENVLLEGIPCTDAEREIILSMCKGGIYL